ncbi:hypothetical protein STEG23_034917, partial [Scotinomys teguina]
MPDLYFYRDPEEIEKEEQAAAEKAVTKEEFQGELTAPAPEFTAAQPEVADWSEGVQVPSVPIQQFPTEDWSAQPATEDWTSPFTRSNALDILTLDNPYSWTLVQLPVLDLRINLHPSLDKGLMTMGDPVSWAPERTTQESSGPSPPDYSSVIPAKMGRRQCKSAYNIIKNKTTPESSPPPTPKSDYCNADKAEENDLKKSLMKMLEEAFEEKMKNVSKEIGENTNKKLEEINKEIEEKKSKKLEEMNNEIEEKKNKKLEEMNNEIEEKKNKRVEEMNKEIEEKRNKKLQELDKEIEEKINKKLKEMNKEIEEKTNKKLEEINKVIEEKTNKKLDEINKEIEDKTNKKLEKINKEIDGKKTKELEEMKKEIEEK